MDDFVEANPQLAGPTSEAARRSTQPVVVEEDHGPLGNLIVGGAKWAANTWVGQKVVGGFAYAFDALEAASKKGGSAASGFVHSQATEQDQTVLASRDDARRALKGDYAEAVAQRNIGKSFENTTADIAREGTEQGIREGVPLVAGVVTGKVTRAVGGLADDVSRGARAPGSPGPPGVARLVYSIRDADDQVIYVGRTSGVGTSQQVLNKRVSTHTHKSAGRFQVEEISDSYEANRGAEEVVFHRERLVAEAEGRKLLNKDLPIGPRNPRRREYVDAYVKEWLSQGRPR